MRVRLAVLWCIAAAPFMAGELVFGHAPTGHPIRVLLLTGAGSLAAFGMLAEFLFMRPWRGLTQALGRDRENIAQTAEESAGSLPELAPVVVRLRRLETEIRRARNENALIDARYRLLADHSEDMVAVVDLDLKYRHLSPACLKIFGCPPEQLVGHSCLENIHADQIADMDRSFQELREGKERFFQAEMALLKDGRWVALDCAGHRWIDPQSGALLGFILVVRDVSQRQLADDRLIEANRRLQALETIDTLTGLPNRRVFDQALSKEWRMATRVPAPLSLLLLDIDQFKPYVELYGHAAGDSCLRSIARLLQEAVRRPGDMVARYGDAMFAIFLPHTGDAGAQALAEKLVESVFDLGLPHKLSAYGVVTASVGVTTMTPSSEIDENTLVARAHRSVLAARKDGYNCVKQDSQATTLLLDISARR